MNSYTEKQITDALAVVESSIAGCEKVRLKLKEGSASFSLNTNRLRALYISKALLTNPDTPYTKEELEKAVRQMASIKEKCTTGIRHAKEGTAVHTRFSRLRNAMDIGLDYLQKAMEHSQ